MRPLSCVISRRSIFVPWLRRVPFTRPMFHVLIFFLRRLQARNLFFSRVQSPCVLSSIVSFLDRPLLSIVFILSFALGNIGRFSNDCFVHGRRLFHFLPRNIQRSTCSRYVLPSFRDLRLSLLLLSPFPYLSVFSILSFFFCCVASCYFPFPYLSLSFICHAYIPTTVCYLIARNSLPVSRILSSVLGYAFSLPFFFFFPCVSFSYPCSIH